MLWLCGFQVSVAKFYTVWKYWKFNLHRVEITDIYFHAFWQKFRESNGFTKEINKQFIWLIFFQWEQIHHFSTFVLSPFFHKIPWNQYVTTSHTVWKALQNHSVVIAQWHRLQRPHSVKIRASGPISTGPSLGPQQNHNQISANKSYDPIALLQKFSPTTFLQKFRQSNISLKSYTVN